MGTRGNLNGTGFTGYGETRFGQALYQGTT